MKMLMLTPCSRVMETEGYLAQAFARFGSVRVYDFLIGKRELVSYEAVNERFAEKVLFERPDILYIQVNDHRIIDPAVVQRLKQQIPQMVVTQWSGDVREWPFDGVIEMGEQCDCNFIANRTLIPVYERITGRRFRFLQHCTLTKQPEPDREKWPHDVVFIANGTTGLNNSHMRHRLVKELARRFGDRFVAYGSGWPQEVSPGTLDWRHQLHCMASARVAVTCANFTCYDGYCSDRFFHALASGACVVAKRFLGMGDLVNIERDVIVWDTVEQCSDWVFRVLGDEGLRYGISRSGQDTATRRHTAKFRVLEYFLHLTELGLIEWPHTTASDRIRLD